MKRFPIGIVVFVFAAVVVGLVALALRVEIHAEKPQTPQVQRTRELAENVALSQHGLYGVTLVSIGRAHMRKMRKGPFTIGAINELVLEDVSLTLPEAEKGAAATNAPWNVEARNEPREILKRLGLDSNRLKFGDRMPRFSALQIQNLKVSRLQGTNAVPWFAARVARARRRGLELADGWVVEDGQRHLWPQAFLLVTPSLKLIWRPEAMK